ncbi:hypothetical protein HBI69_127770 [Parastagonospora nodorum]|nr:hypothetical protein HBI69_127770 [Parastagonospora nodorum]
MLLSWDPNLEQNIPNKIPTETGMTTAQFLSYFIFCLISLPALLIRVHRIQKFFYVTSTITLTFFMVLLIWALATMGPEGFGNTLNSDTSIPVSGSPYSTTWLMIYGIMSTIGSIAAGILNQNDYARFAARSSHAIWGQALAFPMYSIFASVIGILVTAATQNRLGEPSWNPPTLFIRLLVTDNSAGTRAAVFFARLALAISQLGSNLPGNALSGGLDLASVFPKYINLRRGAYIIAILSPVVNPWRLVNTATTFLTVLSGYSVFLAPMTGIMASHYVFVGRSKVNVDDLYIGDSSSVYWYTKGINWRAPLAWVVGALPCLPGFIAALNLSIIASDGAVELYYMNYLYGFLSSALVYLLLHWAVPDKKLDNFVKSSLSAHELQRLYDGRWQVTMGQMPENCDEGVSEQHDSAKAAF